MKCFYTMPTTITVGSLQQYYKILSPSTHFVFLIPIKSTIKFIKSKKRYEKQENIFRN